MIRIAQAANPLDARLLLGVLDAHGIRGRRGDTRPSGPRAARSTALTRFAIEPASILVKHSVGSGLIPSKTQGVTEIDNLELRPRWPRSITRWLER